MSILDRSALEQSPLADLHAIASELSIDGYRRLRKPQLIEAILASQGDAPPAEIAEEPAVAEPEDLTEAVADELEGRSSTRRRRGRRGGRTRAGGREEESESARAADEDEAEPAADERPADERPAEERPAEERPAEERPAEERPAGERPAEEVVEGVVELLANGSGFMRVHPPEPSDDDVYISAAQVKRCDLVSGDRIAGPRRAPRRSERFASLVRVDTINDRPASEVADSARFDELPVAFPSERFQLGSEDPTIKAIEWLTPFGRGSRVVIAGRAQSGKTEALRRLAAAFSGQEELQVLLALIGVRPEEIPEWTGDPVAALSFGASADAQSQALERAMDQGRRLAARGSHAVVLIDTLDALPPHVARKALAAARSIKDGGSLTVIATAAAPLGGETTVVALGAALATTGRFPALNLAESWTMRPELLVGEAGAEAITRARTEALEG
jgi:transcription termination factor Rho